MSTVWSWYLDQIAIVVVIVLSFEGMASLGPCSSIFLAFFSHRNQMDLSFNKKDMQYVGTHDVSAANKLHHRFFF